MFQFYKIISTITNYDQENEFYLSKYIRAIHRENEENFYLNQDELQISMYLLTIHSMMEEFQ